MIDCTLVIFPLSCLYRQLLPRLRPFVGSNAHTWATLERRCYSLQKVWSVRDSWQDAHRYSYSNSTKRYSHSSRRDRHSHSHCCSHDRHSDVKDFRLCFLFPRLRLRFDASVSAYSDDWVIIFYCLLLYLIFTCVAHGAFLLWWSGRLDSRPLHSIAFSYHHILPSYFQSVCQSQHRWSIFQRRQDAHRHSHTNPTKRYTHASRRDRHPQPHC